MTTAIYILIILMIVGIDQFTKYYIVSNFALGESVKIIDGFFDITYVLNDGAGFSILKGQQNLFYLITVVALFFLGYLLYNTEKKNYLEKICLLFMIGGALGNFIDRIVKGCVTDFLDFVIFGYDFPVFNVADSFLTVGVLLYVIVILKGSKNA